MTMIIVSVFQRLELKVELDPIDIELLGMFDEQLYGLLFEIIC